MKRNPVSCKYYIKDHLGNNRVVVDHQGNVMQYTHYYPYGGMLHLSTEPGYQNFKYDGKEYDTMHGLNEYDYGARQEGVNVYILFEDSEMFKKLKKFYEKL